MDLSLRRPASCLGATVILILNLIPAWSQELQLGTGSAVINPPPGIGLAGYYHERGNDGVLDDLKARAIVLDDGTTRAAIVICDLISMPKWIVDEARHGIELRTGIPAGHVMIAATHTHTAPVLDRESADKTAAAGPASARDYLNALPARLVDAVVAATGQRVSVRIVVAKEREPDLAHNRRYWMRDGNVGWNPGKENPGIVRPAGPIDPEVGVLVADSVVSPFHSVLTFVNYAMHPDTTGGTRVSADYPGALGRILALYKGPDMLTLFANGTCGNINHVDVRWQIPQTSPEEATRLGATLAAAVFKAYTHLHPVTNAPVLRVRSQKVTLPLPPFTAEELEIARSDARTATDTTREGFMKLVRARRVLDVAARMGQPLEVEMQVIALGRDVAWVAWPGEIFVELGLSVKAVSPFPNTYNIELANGAVGYIPDRPAYAEGNYEVESARVAEGAGERLVSSALEMLAGIHEEAQRDAWR